MCTYCGFDHAAGEYMTIFSLNEKEQEEMESFILSNEQGEQEGYANAPPVICLEGGFSACLDFLSVPHSISPF